MTRSFKCCNMAGMENRNKHIGLVVEPKMYDELRKIADGKYLTLSTLIYSVLKEWLKKKESESRG